MADVDPAPGPDPAPAPDPAPNPDPAPAPAPDPAPAASWRDGLSDEVRGHPAIKDHASVDAVVQDYINQNELIGRKGIIPLGDNATAEDWAKFNADNAAALGRPENAADYNFAMPDGREATADEKVFHDAMRPGLHAGGLNQFQVDAVVATWNGHVAASKKASEDAGANAIAALNAEWGVNAEARQADARRAYQAFAPEAALPHLNAIMGVAEATRFLAAVGEAIGEHGMMPGGATPLNLTPEQAKAEIESMETDETKRQILFESGHPEHEALVKRRSMLYQVADKAGARR